MTTKPKCRPQAPGFFTDRLVYGRYDGDSLAIVTFVPFVDDIFALLWREPLSSMYVAKILVPVKMFLERGAEIPVRDVILVVDTSVGAAADIEVSIVADLSVGPVLGPFDEVLADRCFLVAS